MAMIIASVVARKITRSALTVLGIASVLSVEFGARLLRLGIVAVFL